MISLTRKSTLLTTALTAALLTNAAVGQDESAGTATKAAVTGSYTGVLVDPAMTIPRDLTHHIDIEVDRLTPKAKFERMIRLLESEGQDALEREIWEEEVGRVQIDQGLSHPINAAFLIDGDRGIGHLVLVIDRPMSVGEIYHGLRSRNYPFSVIEIDLEKDGDASGEMMVAARMSYVSDTLSIENLAFQPLRILDIDRTEA